MKERTVKKFSMICLLSIALSLLSNIAFPKQAGEDPLQTVASVDLERYIGKWYEIAAIPQRFQAGCAATTAQYSLRDDGHIGVVNSCRLKDGSIKNARGTAWAVDESNAKLKVRFFWPFSGDYWIIELAEDYSYAVVGHPNRDYLWILARSSEMESALFDTLMESIGTKHGYDLSKIVKTLP